METEQKNKKKGLRVVEEQNKEYKELLQRLQAEFENYRKRTEKEKERMTQEATKELMIKILPVVDNFEIALKEKPEDEFARGIEITYKELKRVLEKEGLQKIEPNKTFNPEYHEALIAEESDQEKDTILEEIQPGYMFKDLVIRPAKVKIAKTKGGKENE